MKQISRFTCIMQLPDSMFCASFLLVSHDVSKEPAAYVSLYELTKWSSEQQSFSSLHLYVFGVFGFNKDIFIHYVVTVSREPLLKQVFQRVYLNLFLPSSCIFSFPEGHSVAVYIFFLVFFAFYLSWITCFRRQILRKMWPIQLAFLRFIVCRVFLSFLTLRNTSCFTRSVWYSPSFSGTYFKTFKFLLIYFLKCLSFSTIQNYLQI
jgi:hypothetical protein